MQQALSSNIPHALTLDVAERLWELASHTLIYIFFLNQNNNNNNDELSTYG